MRLGHFCLDITSTEQNQFPIGIGIFDPQKRFRGTYQQFRFHERHRNELFGAAVDNLICRTMASLAARPGVNAA